jgi:putative dimethyl sulfoxide reductase chaperone
MTMAEVTALRSPEIQGMLGRAAIYELLSLAFTYPDEDSVQMLRAFLQDVAGHDIAYALDLHEDLAAIEGALKAASLQELAGEHSHLFAGEIICSAHETEYERDAFVKSRQLADIAGFYHAFGLKVAESRRGLPDFIATELEFMSLVIKKEAYAALHGMEEERQVSVDAQKSFIEAHVGRWLPTFCSNLSEVSAGFYVAAAALLERFIRFDTDLSGARPHQAVGRLTVSDDADAFKCGLVAADEEEDEMIPLEEWPAAVVEDTSAIIAGLAAEAIARTTSGESNGGETAAGGRGERA